MYCIVRSTKKTYFLLQGLQYILFLTSNIMAICFQIYTLVGFTALKLCLQYVYCYFACLSGLDVHLLQTEIYDCKANRTTHYTLCRVSSFFFLSC
jgi:hypothetical protein